MCSGFIRRHAVIAGRAAFVLAAAFAACSSSVKAQAIEEDGLPAKGVDNYSEPFSLSCPSRLYVRAGESLPLSCVATGVPEEGVRYEWASVSGGGVRHLSAPDELSPFFTAPVSGASSEYAYRLTATGPGVYATASVTVTVEGVPGRSSGLPGLHEECDPLTAPDDPGSGCAPWERGPEPFGFGSEEEEDFLFPGGSGLPDEEGAFDRSSPPRLECPAAVFLEELETGQIECHAWDDSGEEHLEYSWEPVGSTTRNYLDNPRLIPENSPVPLAIAPEAPSYETLESFLSGDRAFRYRYRLTATSRATGFSSHAEVEIYVSSSRPVVYCSPEIVAKEGETVSLDCEGVDPLFFRMGYDEEAASVLWEWEGLWGASTANLAETHLSSPLFTAPPGSAGDTFHYIASMTTSASGAPRTARRKVAVKVAVGGAGEDTEAYQSVPLAGISCSGTSFTRYAGSGNIRVDCNLSGVGTGVFRWLWKAWSADGLPQTVSCCGGWPWSRPDRLSIVDITDAVFSMPSAVDDTTIYKYSVGVWRVTGRIGTLYDSEDITITVLPKPAITVTCEDLGAVHEGSSDVAFDCSASGAPGDDPQYAYAWTARGDTGDTSLLSAADIASPTFYVPDEVDENETYEYLLTVSAGNAEDGSAEVSVTVLNHSALHVVCADPGSVYEGSEDIAFDCSAFWAPSGSSYAYAWTARGDTQDTSLLSATDIASPTFDVPDELDATATYEYLLTASAENVENGSAAVSVTVLNKGALAVACADPGSVYEGSEDVAFDCEASGAPDGSGYEYAWTARGDTQDTSLLSATDIASPTFDVPDELDAMATYEYLLTVSAQNADPGSASVTVTVLNKGALAVACADPGSAYEGSEDIAFACSASGAQGDDPQYAYAWTARGDTEDTSLLSAADIASPTFHVPEEVAATTTYEYLLTVSAQNAEDGSASVTVTVLNKGALAVACADPGSAYEGSSDVAFDCSASGAPGDDPQYAYAWTAPGDTQDTSLLSAADIASPTFYVPDEVDENETYEYLLTVSAENAEDGEASVTVTVLNKGALLVVCAAPGSAYEGSSDVAFDCSASGAPGDDPQYAYAWTARGDTEDTSLLSATDIASPTFHVPEEVAATTAYEYLLTVSAENAENGSASVTVTVLNKGALFVACADPGSVYEGAADVAFDCEAAGASAYEYAWTARGDTEDTSLLSATDIASPTFHVPTEVAATTTYEYLLTVRAANAEDGSASVTVTVLNKGALLVACADPGSAYEGAADVAFDCSASGAPGDDPQYAYAWTARGDTEDTSLLSAADIASPTFYVPAEVDENETYEYLLTVSAENAEGATAEVAVTVLNKGALLVACADPGSVYEGTADVAFDCSASGAPGDNPQYTYAWTAEGDTEDASLLSAADIASPTFHVPEEAAATTSYEYLLTVRAANAEDGSASVTVTVLNKPALAAVCADPGSVYEGSEDIVFDCSASGAPGDDPQYAYAWTARGDTQDTSLLSATNIASPTFYVPEEVAATTTYEYLLTVSAENAEGATAEVAVTVLDRVVTPDPEPVTPPVASSTDRSPSDPSSLGLTVSASPLRFGVQSADTQVSLDPVTDGVSTYISGPYHAGRMTLAPGGGEALDENGEMDMSIELLSPVSLKRADGIEAASLMVTPRWSYAESCEQLSSQTLGGLYTEITLSETDCRLLRFGGELDLTGVLSGHYAGRMDIVLRSGENEETHSVEVVVTVVPARRAITIGPGGVRFDTSRDLPAGLTEEQNLSIYPGVAFLTERNPDGVFELSNPSLVPLEVSVSARFGYTEATEDGREVVVEDIEDSDLGDLSEVVDIHPGVLILQPGEKGLVRYGVKAEAHKAMSEQGYAAFFDVVSEPRRYADLDRMPEEVTDDRTARVTMRVPGVYIPGEGASQLRATLLSVSYVGSLSATFLLETDRPFAGEVAAYDGEGRELGRRETLVYTRSRVRIPLDRMPEEGAVFLRFTPRGSGQAPLPASVEWNAPRRDIGAAGNP